MVPHVVKHCESLHTLQAAHAELSWKVSCVSVGRHPSLAQ